MSDRPTAPAVRVQVAVVNYRTPDLVLDCLRSLAVERERLPGLTVAVADSASGDDSVVRLRKGIAAEGWEAWARVIALPGNRGFAHGNNAVIEPALRDPEPPDYVLLLNPDTTVRPGAVARLVAFLEEHADVGIAGSRLEGSDGSVQVSAFRFPGVLGELEWAARIRIVSRWLARFKVAPDPRDVAHPTDWVSGAAMLVRRGVFERVGLMDDGYFLYFEETDFCLAARRSGFACWHVPESRIVHLVAQSTGVSADPEAGRRPAYWFESRRRYYLKNWSPVKALAADLVLLLGMVFWRLRRRLQQRAEKDPPHFLSDLLRHSVLRRGFRL